MPTINKRRNRDRSASDVAQVRIRPFEPVSKAFATKDDAVRVGEPSAPRIGWALKRGIDTPLTGPVEPANGAPR